MVFRFYSNEIYRSFAGSIRLRSNRQKRHPDCCKNCCNKIPDFFTEKDKCVLCRNFEKLNPTIWPMKKITACGSKNESFFGGNMDVLCQNNVEKRSFFEVLRKYSTRSHCRFDVLSSLCPNPQNDQPITEKEVWQQTVVHWFEDKKVLWQKKTSVKDLSLRFSDKTALKHLVFRCFGSNSRSESHSLVGEKKMR